VSREGPNSNPKIQGKLRNRDKVVELQRQADLKLIMDSPGGRRFMYDMIFERCGTMNVYPGSDSGIYRHEGQRTLGAKLVLDLQEKLSVQYVQMINEHLEALTSDQKLREAALTPEPGDDPDA
jgi:hypothetical protein